MMAGPLQRHIASLTFPPEEDYPRGIRVSCPNERFIHIFCDCISMIALIVSIHSYICLLVRDSEVFEKRHGSKARDREFRVVRNGEHPAAALGIDGLDG